MDCIFCDFDKTKLENTIIEETKNFYIMTDLGSLVRGYLLIVAKKHILSMSLLSEKEMLEYKELIEKYRKKFLKIYGKYPIIFEHGSGNSFKTVASVIHAHTHIVNYNFLDEESIIKELNFEMIENIKNIKDDYIYYLSPENIEYISNRFNYKSQLMRFIIAKDLKVEDKYNWRQNPCLDNVRMTITDFLDNDNYWKLIIYVLG